MMTRDFRSCKEAVAFRAENWKAGFQCSLNEFYDEEGYLFSVTVWTAEEWAELLTKAKNY